jgi:biotin operon repressor
MTTVKADGGLWISARELAAERGISRAAVTQNLRRWAERGAPVATKWRGRVLLVNAREYDTRHRTVADQVRVQAEAVRRALRMYDESIP